MRTTASTVLIDRDGLFDVELRVGHRVAVAPGD